MNIYLIGNDDKYGAEQMLLTLYPTERPVYPEGPAEGDSVTLRLFRGERFAAAACRLSLGGKTFRGQARQSLARLGTGPDAVRRERHLLKLAFYRAALSAGHEKPVWGCLTGVRPAKFFAGLMDRDGLNFEEAERALVRRYGVEPDRAALCAAAARAAQAARESLSPEDICLYIGIPYCPTHCAYCSFVSVDAPRMLQTIPAYLSALRREMEAAAAAVRESGRRIAAVYIGGGTPTTLSPDELRDLITSVRRIFDLSGCREFTVEAGRPDTITGEKLAVLRQLGVDRVSVNPQSMSDAVLAAIGRRHSAQEVRRAVEMVKEAGLAFNMDLIAGLPGDSPESFRETMEEVIAMGPENITVHTLALKKGSRFLTEGTALPSGEAVGQMLSFAGEALPRAGYGPYYMYRQKFMSGSFENVGWSRPGFENLYNICIMEELCSILALGAGGSTKLVGAGGLVRRQVNPKYPREYMERIEDLCAAKGSIPGFFQNKEE